MSPQEIEDMRSQNMCFFCDEKYYPGHKRRARVYRPEVIEEEEH